MLVVLRYQAADGSEPFSDWLRSIGDKSVQARIRLRLQRTALGNFGDCTSVGEGVRELRIHDGPGYRIYFGMRGNSLVLLLCGGTKKNQSDDIRRARSYWHDWKQRQT